MCVKKDVLVQNQVGLHARPATFFIQKANEFKSSIWVEKDERRVNAKSLLGVLVSGHRRRYVDRPSSLMVPTSRKLLTASWLLLNPALPNNFSLSKRRLSEHFR